MNPNELRSLRSLQEAYMDVYSVDEGLGSAIKRVFGGKKKEEAPTPKPMSRGEQLRKKYNVGPERSDTSAKRQILDRTRAKAERDQKQYGGSVYTQRVADDSKAAHERYLRAGYSKYGANLKHGKGSKAAKKAASLRKEEVDLYDIILSHLLDEGYAETPEAAEVIMVNMSEDWRESIVEEILDEGVAGRNDARIRDNIERFKGSTIEYTPPKNWSPEENRGKGATISPKQAEKRRRKALRN